MQRAAHRPRADETGAESVKRGALGACAHGQLTGAAILGLEAEDGSHRGDGISVARTGEPLGAEAVAAGLGGGQAACSALPAAETGRVSPSARGGSRRETTFDTPLPAIDTPYRQSAASIVRFWCVTMMNWARSENRLTSCRKRSMFASSSAAST
jgi:hypothetical protein